MSGQKELIKNLEGLKGGLIIQTLFSAVHFREGLSIIHT